VPLKIPKMPGVGSPKAGDWVQAALAETAKHPRAKHPSGGDDQCPLQP
jgi:hypothetical protein